MRKIFAFLPKILKTKELHLLVNKVDCYLAYGHRGVLFVTAENGLKFYFLYVEGLLQRRLPTMVPTGNKA